MRSGYRPARCWSNANSRSRCRPIACVAELSGIRSTKLVSSRLKPVVCELAMLPEIFSSAKDCARMPVTAVVRAPKIPMNRPSTYDWPQTQDAIGPQ